MTLPGRLLQWIGVALVTCLPNAAFSQYMYLDANGDGLSNALDRLSNTGSTQIDLWLDSSRNRDSSSTSCSEDLTVNSYEFILHATGGTVTWSAFTNHLPGAVVPFLEVLDSTDYHNGFGGTVQSGPGRFKLASLLAIVSSGSPQISITKSTHLSSSFTTAFGSKCPGLDADNTLKLGSDWFDTNGLNAPTALPIIVAPKTLEAVKEAPISITVEAVDPTGTAPPSLSAVGYPQSLAFSVSVIGPYASRGVLEGTPGPSETGPYTIIWTATTEAGSASDTTGLEMIDFNFKPVVTSPSVVNGHENSTITFPVHVFDEEGDPIISLTASFTSLPLGHNATFVTNQTKTLGTFSWTPNFSHAGSYSVTFTASGTGTGTRTTVINVANQSPARYVRLQLPAPGYRVNVRYYWCPTNGLCKQETLTAGDSGQVYVPVNRDPENGNFALWDMIRVEFPARTHSAYFTVPESQGQPFSSVASNPQFIGHPVEWQPPVTMPPYNYNYVPTMASQSFVRLLAITDQIYKFWADVYGMSVTPEEIRLWEDLEGPDYYHFSSPFISFNYIRWPWDLDRYQNPSGVQEAYILAHEFTHVMQHRAIFSLDDYPSGSGDHNICSDGDAEQSWKEGMANGMAEYFLVRARGQRYGTNANAGVGLGYEQRTSNWTCSSYTPSTEATASFYVYLLNSRTPREFMDCLRLGTFNRTGLGVRHAQSLIDFHELWNDRNPWGSTIVTHRPGSWNDEGAYRYAQGIVTGVEDLGSVPLDDFGGVRKVYPTPSRGLISVEALGPGGGVGIVRIVQPSGRVVREARFSGLTPGEYQTLQVDVDGLAAGVYFLWYSDATDRGIRAGRKFVVLK